MHNTLDIAATRELVVDVIRQMPGMTSKEITALISGANHTVVRSDILPELYRAGIVDRELGQANKPCAGRQPYIYSIATNPTPRKVEVKPKMRRKKPSATGYEAQIAELKAQVHELEQWKAAAIGRFPDLAVADVVVKARKIVAAQLRESGDPKRADDTLAGRCDTTVLMKSVVAALELV